MTPFEPNKFLRPLVTLTPYRPPCKQVAAMLLPVLHRVDPRYENEFMQFFSVLSWSQEEQDPTCFDAFQSQTQHTLPRQSIDYYTDVSVSARYEFEGRSSMRHTVAYSAAIRCCPRSPLGQQPSTLLLWARLNQQLKWK